MAGIRADPKPCTVVQADSDMSMDLYENAKSVQVQIHDLGICAPEGMAPLLLAAWEAHILQYHTLKAVSTGYMRTSVSSGFIGQLRGNLCSRRWLSVKEEETNSVLGKRKREDLPE